jgi:GxxExxY protein
MFPPGLAPAPHGPHFAPALLHPAHDLTAMGGSQILSQGERENESPARDFGFTHYKNTFGATQAAVGRGKGMQQRQAWGVSERVIGACIEVHRVLGPGLLEGAYEAALCEELSLQNLPFKRQCTLPIEYKGRLLDQTYRADLIVADQLLVEVKSVEAILFVHVAQVVTYLRVTGLSAGLIVNFNAAPLRNGLRRVSLPPKNSHDSRSPVLPVKSRPA